MNQDRTELNRAQWKYLYDNQSAARMNFMTELCIYVPIDFSWVILHVLCIRCLICELQVSLRWSQDRAEPGGSVSLSVSVSEPGSLVGILVVDKGTLDSKTDNGITDKTVQWFNAIWICIIITEQSENLEGFWGSLFSRFLTWCLISFIVLRFEFEKSSYRFACFSIVCAWKDQTITNAGLPMLLNTWHYAPVSV